VKNNLNTVPPDWYKRSFNHDYIRIYAYKDETTTQETTAILTYLDLPDTVPASSGPTILDTACGWGRHAIELAKRGYRVTGLDLSPIMLQEAKKRAREAEVAVRWLHMDLRDMHFDNEFDVVINMFTSFGYFDDEKENVKVLQNVSRSLVSGGKFLLDLDNPEYFIKKQGRDKLRLPTKNRLAGESILKEEFLHWKRERRVAYSFLDRRTKEDDIVLRCYLYDYNDIKSLIEENTDLKVEPTAWGDFSGLQHPTPKLSEDLPRLIIIARKP
jgi:SAM-dependent methyltransferase